MTVTMKVSNPGGRAGKHPLPGVETARFFDRYTHKINGAHIINGRYVGRSFKRSLQRWRAGQPASQRAVLEALEYFGFSKVWFFENLGKSA